MSKKMSKYPNVNPRYEDRWEESKKHCPKCKDKLLWQAGWFDDDPDNGGACIGTMYECGDCNHYESW